jgi:hypothetical protein
MSMPKIEIQKDLTRENALLNLLATVALKEAAFAHLLNADGEKMQLVVSLADPESILYDSNITLQSLNDVEQSVTDFVEIIQIAEDALHDTMDDAFDFVDTLPPWEPEGDLKYRIEFRLLAANDDHPLVGGRFGAIAEEPDARSGFSRALKSYNATSQPGGWVALDVPPGQYQLRQSRSVSGYTKDPCKYTLDVEANGDYVVKRLNGTNCSTETWNPGTGFTVVYNAISTDPDETNIPAPKIPDIYQSDAYCLSIYLRTPGSELPVIGATFYLLQPNGTQFVPPVYGTSDGDGAIYFGKIAAGTYKLRETTSPDGYAVVPDKTVVITDAGAPDGKLPDDTELAEGYITIDGEPSMKIFVNRQ